MKKLVLSILLISYCLFLHNVFASEIDLKPIIPVSGYKIDFHAGANRTNLVSGWSSCVEDGGVWSDGPEAKITVSLPNKPSTDLLFTIDGLAFLALTHLKQEIEIFVNGSQMPNLLYDTRSTLNKQVLIPYGALSKTTDQQLELLLKFKNPCVPLVAQVTPDTRTLGIYLRSIIFKELFCFVPDFESPFENIVTLGDCCAPKIQVEQYFNSVYPGQLKEYTGGRNLFDFMAPRKLSLLADAIGHKLEGCCGKDMVVRPAHWVPHLYTPVDRYEMSFSHLFDDHPIVKGPANLTQVLFDQYFEKDILPKIDYMKRKFLTNKRRTLYILLGVILSDKTDFTQLNIIKLRDSLAAQRGDANFCMLVWCDRDYNFKSTENIKFIVLAPPTYAELHTPMPRFAAMMKEFKFLPTNMVE